MKLPVTSALALTISLGLSAAAHAAPDDATVEHLLGRAGYGHDNWSRQRVADLNWNGYVNEQLEPTTINDNLMAQAYYQDPRFEAWHMSPAEIAATWSNRKDVNKRSVGELIRMARAEFFLRGVISRRQLEALMTEFWFNHFNVQLTGERARRLIPYIRAIRKHAFGKFQDLLMVVAKSPAMMGYLDNEDNFRDGYKIGNRSYGINENYARELLELHTLGATDDSSFYTQQDIIEAARCLTGWNVNEEQLKFRFDLAGHDKGAKTVMTLKVAADGGLADGEQLIRYLANHGRTATYITAKLVRFFAGPGQNVLHSSTRQKWLDTKGNIKAVLRHILLSQEIRATVDKKVKRPTLWVISALRAAQADMGSGDARFDLLQKLYGHAYHLGQPLYNVAPPTGWDDANTAFLNPGTLLNSYDRFISLFVNNPVRLPWNPRGADEAKTISGIETRVFRGAPLSQETRAALTGYYGELKNLASGKGADFALALTFSTPEFIRY